MTKYRSYGKVKRFPKGQGALIKTPIQTRVKMNLGDCDCASTSRCRHKKLTFEDEVLQSSSKIRYCPYSGRKLYPENGTSSFVYPICNQDIQVGYTETVSSNQFYTDNNTNTICPSTNAMFGPSGWTRLPSPLFEPNNDGSSQNRRATYCSERSVSFKSDRKRGNSKRIGNVRRTRAAPSCQSVSSYDSSDTMYLHQTLSRVTPLSTRGECSRPESLSSYRGCEYSFQRRFEKELTSESDEEQLEVLDIQYFKVPVCERPPSPGSKRSHDDMESLVVKHTVDTDSDCVRDVEEAKHGMSTDEGSDQAKATVHARVVKIEQKMFFGKRDHPLRSDGQPIGPGGLPCACDPDSRPCDLIRPPSRTRNEQPTLPSDGPAGSPIIRLNGRLCGPNGHRLGDSGQAVMVNGQSCTCSPNSYPCGINGHPLGAKGLPITSDGRSCNCTIDSAPCAKPTYPAVGVNGHLLGPEGRPVAANGYICKCSPESYPCGPNGHKLGQNGQPIARDNTPCRSCKPDSFPCGPNGHTLTENGQPITINGLSCQCKVDSYPCGMNGHKLSENGQPMASNGHPCQCDPDSCPCGPNGHPLGQNGQPISIDGRSCRCNLNSYPCGPNGHPLGQNGQPVTKDGQPCNCKPELHFSQCIQEDPQSKEDHQALSGLELQANKLPVIVHKRISPLLVSSRSDAPSIELQHLNDRLPESITDPNSEKGQNGHGHPLNQNGHTYTIRRNGQSCKYRLESYPCGQNGHPFGPDGEPIGQNCRPCKCNPHDFPCGKNGHPLGENGQPIAKNGNPCKCYPVDFPCGLYGHLMGPNDQTISQNGNPCQCGPDSFQCGPNGHPLESDGRPITQNGQPCRCGLTSFPFGENGHPLGPNGQSIRENGQSCICGPNSFPCGPNAHPLGLDNKAIDKNGNTCVTFPCGPDGPSVGPGCEPTSQNGEPSESYKKSFHCGPNGHPLGTKGQPITSDGRSCNCSIDSAPCAKPTYPAVGVNGHLLGPEGQPVAANGYLCKCSPESYPCGTNGHPLNQKKQPVKMNGELCKCTPKSYPCGQNGHELGPNGQPTAKDNTQCRSCKPDSFPCGPNGHTLTENGQPITINGLSCHCKVDGYPCGLNGHELTRYCQPIDRHGYPCKCDLDAHPCGLNGHPLGENGRAVMVNGKPCSCLPDSYPCGPNGHPLGKTKQLITRNGQPCLCKVDSYPCGLNGHKLTANGQPMARNGHPCQCDPESCPCGPNSHPLGQDGQSVTRDGQPCNCKPDLHFSQCGQEDPQLKEDHQARSELDSQADEQSVVVHIRISPLLVSSRSDAPSVELQNLNDKLPESITDPNSEKGQNGHQLNHYGHPIMRNGQPCKCRPESYPCGQNGHPFGPDGEPIGQNFRPCKCSPHDFACGKNGHPLGRNGQPIAKNGNPCKCYPVNFPCGLYGHLMGPNDQTISQNGNPCKCGPNSFQCGPNGHPFDSDGQPTTRNGQPCKCGSKSFPCGENGHPLGPHGHPIRENGQRCGCGSNSFPCGENGHPLGPNGQPIRQNGQPCKCGPISFPCGIQGHPLGPNGQPIKQNGQLCKCGPKWFPCGPNGHPLDYSGQSIDRNGHLCIRCYPIDFPCGPNGHLMGPNGQPVSQNGEFCKCDSDSFQCGPNGHPLGPNGQPTIQKGLPCKCSLNSFPCGPNGHPLGPKGEPLGNNGKLCNCRTSSFPCGKNGHPLDPNGQPINQSLQPCRCTPKDFPCGPNSHFMGPESRPISENGQPCKCAPESFQCGPNGHLLGPSGQPISQSGQPCQCWPSSLPCGQIDHHLKRDDQKDQSSIKHNSQPFEQNISNCNSRRTGHVQWLDHSCQPTSPSFHNAGSSPEDFSCEYNSHPLRCKHPLGSNGQPIQPNGDPCDGDNCRPDSKLCEIHELDYRARSRQRTLSCCDSVTFSLDRPASPHERDCPLFTGMASPTSFKVELPQISLQIKDASQEPRPNSPHERDFHLYRHASPTSFKVEMPQINLRQRKHSSQDLISTSPANLKVEVPHLNPGGPTAKVIFERPWSRAEHLILDISPNPSGEGLTNDAKIPKQEDAIGKQTEAPINMILRPKPSSPPRSCIIEIPEMESESPSAWPSRAPAGSPVSYGITLPDFSLAVKKQKDLTPDNRLLTSGIPTHPTSPTRTLNTKVELPKVHYKIKDTEVRDEKSKRAHGSPTFKVDLPELPSISIAPRYPVDLVGSSNSGKDPLERFNSLEGHASVLNFVNPVIIPGEEVSIALDHDSTVVTSAPGRKAKPKRFIVKIDLSCFRGNKSTSDLHINTIPALPSPVTWRTSITSEEDLQPLQTGKTFCNIDNQFLSRFTSETNLFRHLSLDDLLVNNVKADPKGGNDRDSYFWFSETSITERLIAEDPDFPIDFFFPNKCNKHGFRSKSVLSLERLSPFRVNVPFRGFGSDESLFKPKRGFGSDGNLPKTIRRDSITLSQGIDETCTFPITDIFIDEIIRPKPVRLTVPTEGVGDDDTASISPLKIVVPKNDEFTHNKPADATNSDESFSLVQTETLIVDGSPVTIIIPTKNEAVKAPEDASGNDEAAGETVTLVVPYLRTQEDNEIEDENDDQSYTLLCTDAAVTDIPLEMEKYVSKDRGVEELMKLDEEDNEVDTLGYYMGPVTEVTVRTGTDELESGRCSETDSGMATRSPGTGDETETLVENEKESQPVPEETDRSCAMEWEDPTGELYSICVMSLLTFLSILYL